MKREMSAPVVVSPAPGTRSGVSTGKAMNSVSSHEYPMATSPGGGCSNVVSIIPSGSKRTASAAVAKSTSVAPAIAAPATVYPTLE